MGPGAAAPGEAEGRSPRLAYFYLSNTAGTLLVIVIWQPCAFA